MNCIIGCLKLRLISLGRFIILLSTGAWHLSTGFLITSLVIRISTLKEKDASASCKESNLRLVPSLIPILLSKGFPPSLNDIFLCTGGLVINSECFYAIHGFLRQIFFCKLKGQKYLLIVFK